MNLYISIPRLNYTEMSVTIPYWPQIRNKTESLLRYYDPGSFVDVIETLEYVPFVNVIQQRLKSPMISNNNDTVGDIVVSFMWGSVGYSQIRNHSQSLKKNNALSLLIILQALECERRLSLSLLRHINTYFKEVFRKSTDVWSWMLVLFIDDRLRQMEIEQSCQMSLFPDIYGKQICSANKLTFHHGDYAKQLQNIKRCCCEKNNESDTDEECCYPKYYNEFSIIEIVRTVFDNAV